MTDIEATSVISRKCDIRLEKEIQSGIDGVTAVFHCAEIKPCLFRSQSMDNETLLWETNVHGTANVIKACRNRNVQNLIFTSSIGAVMSGKKIVNHTESQTPKAEEAELVLGLYGRSKKKAEELVAGAHLSLNTNGDKLSTIIIRPTALYGEGDKDFIPPLIKMSFEAGGRLPALGSPFAYHQLTYAGNAAAAHVHALFHLQAGGRHPLRDCGGLPIYVCDETPPGKSDEVLKPFLKACNQKTTKPTQYLFLTLWFTFMLTIWVAVCEKVGKHCEWAQSKPTTVLHKIAGTTTILNGVRASVALGFTPVYSWEESLHFSVTYYKRLFQSRKAKEA